MRRHLIDQYALLEMRPGDVGASVTAYATVDVAEDNRRALNVEARDIKDLGLGHAHVGGTTYLDAVDREGNMVAATPSGGWLGISPVSKGLGFPLVTRQGKLFMVFGTPGGDSQEQWTLQFFLNYVEFVMNLQEVLDMPTVHSVHFPSSSRHAYPEHLVVESHIAPAVLAELQRCGHKVTVTEAWAHGKVMGIHYDMACGVTIDRATPKGIIGYAIGW